MSWGARVKIRQKARKALMQLKESEERRIEWERNRKLRKENQNRMFKQQMERRRGEERKQQTLSS